MRGLNVWSSWSWDQNGGWDHNWKEYHTRDRPYLSHLDFPKFDGRREGYADYRYQALNLKSQCSHRDHTYLAPKLISNFTGAMSDDARSMDINSSDYLVGDGVERLPGVYP